MTNILTLEIGECINYILTLKAKFMKTIWVFLSQCCLSWVYFTCLCEIWLRPSLRLVLKICQPFFGYFDFFFKLWPILCKQNAIWGEKIMLFHEKLPSLGKKTKYLKDGWQIFRTNLMDGPTKFHMMCIISPQILSNFSDFWESVILSKKHRSWQRKTLFVTFVFLKRGIFFLRSQKLIRILDSGKFGYLKSSISDFMAQKWPNYCHFLTQNGPDSSTLSDHNLKRMEFLNSVKSVESTIKSSFK